MGNKKNPKLKAEILAAVMASDPRLSLSGPDGNTQLHHAVKDGHVAEAARLLRAGVDVDAENAKGETPVWSAVRIGDEACYEGFRRTDFRADQVNRDGESLLHAAVSGKNPEILADLCERCETVRAGFINWTWHSSAPLDVALREVDPDGALGISRVLLEWGAECPHGDAVGVKAYLALKNGDLERAHFLLEFLPRRGELRPWVKMGEHAVEAASPETLEKLLGLLGCDERESIDFDKTWISPQDLLTDLAKVAKVAHALPEPPNDEAAAKQVRIMAMIDAKGEEAHACLRDIGVEAQAPGA